MKKYFFLLLSCSAMVVSAQPGAVDKADSNEKVFRTPDVDAKPQLKNGMFTLSAFISNNFKFPDLKNKKIKIFASFIVEPDGSMSDVRTFYISVKDLVVSEQVKIATEEEKQYEAKQTESLKLEAVRVLSAFNEKWIPAQENGKTVRCLYNYPINFNIE
ncbi:MAG TPA: hypothetical protein VK528_03270 [Flavobacterium sp.]|nr:hypothetical protein [Flavobacterium sp.]